VIQVIGIRNKFMSLVEQQKSCLFYDTQQDHHKILCTFFLLSAILTHNGEMNNNLGTAEYHIMLPLRCTCDIRNKICMMHIISDCTCPSSTISRKSDLDSGLCQSATPGMQPRYYIEKEYTRPNGLSHSTKYYHVVNVVLQSQITFFVVLAD